MLLVSALAWCAGVSCVELASASIEIIAYGGEEAVGTGGVTFGSFQSPTINQAGEVMVHGLLTVGGDVTNFNNNGVWLVDPDGQWRLVARAGDQVEGMAGGVRYNYFLSDPLQYEGGVIVPVKLQGSGVTTENDQAYFRSEPGSLPVLLAREGGTAASFPGATYKALAKLPGVDGQGRIAFNAALSGDGIASYNSDGVWADLGGGLEMIARQFSAVPGGLPGELFYFSDGTPWLSGTGLVQVPVSIQNSLDNWKNYTAVTTYNGSAYTIHARYGEQVTGEAAGVVFDYFARQSIDAHGKVVFSARYAGPGISIENELSVWSAAADGSNAATLFRGGTTEIPGTGGATFLTIADYLGLVRNQSGDLAAHLQLQGSGVTDQNDACLVLRKADGSLHLLAREGDQAAGVDVGVLWGPYPSIPTLNDSTRVAFTADLRGSGVTQYNDGGLWVWDESRGGRLLIREGDGVEVAPGDLRTVDYINLRSTLTAGAGNRYTVLNNDGVLVFALKFTDGSGATCLWREVTTPMQGDLNGDQLVDLADLVISLKVISNTPVAPLSLGGDVDGDGKIGGAESLFILGQCAGPL